MFLLVLVCDLGNEQEKNCGLMVICVCVSMWHMFNHAC